MKRDFAPFPIGRVHNPLPAIAAKPAPLRDRVTIRYPSRLNAMALDPSKIATNENLVYRAGELAFCIARFREVTVELSERSACLEINAPIGRRNLVRHAILLMRAALSTNVGLRVSMEQAHSERHLGFGSSSGTIAAVAACVNELFGRPIPARVLIRYVAQNHGEEIDGNDEQLAAVQCLGGSAAAGMLEGSVFVVAGAAAVIGQWSTSALPVVVGVPQEVRDVDAAAALAAEIAAFPRFVETGHRHAQHVAYRLVHEVMPALSEGDLRPLGDLVYDYRFNMGSIENCSFLYPQIRGIAERLRDLKLRGDALVLSLSSVGPAFFAISSTPTACEEAFQSAGLSTSRTELHNGTYSVIR